MHETIMKLDAVRSVNSLHGAIQLNKHISVHDTYSSYSTQLFQLRFKVFPELSGKVEYERERLNTVLKCGPISKVIFSTLHSISSRLSAAS
jgi:hypothetical protein